MFDFIKPYENYIFYGLVIITIIIGIVIFFKKHKSDKLDSSDICLLIFIGYIVVNAFAFSNIKNGIINGIQEILLVIIIHLNLFFAYKYFSAKGTPKPYEKIVSEEENIEIKKAVFTAAAKKRVDLVEPLLYNKDELSKILYLENKNKLPYVCVIKGTNISRFKGRLLLTPITFAEYCCGLSLYEIYEEFERLFYEKFGYRPTNIFNDVIFEFENKNENPDFKRTDFITAEAKISFNNQKVTIKILKILNIENCDNRYFEAPYDFKIKHKDYLKLENDFKKMEKRYFELLGELDDEQQ